MREKVLLICSECLARNYVTTISKDAKKAVEIKKYCKHCNKMTVHKISK
ncbi:MAG: 50S ribosomal protein L33 [Bacilli bacterium]|nr:50S ribosomal protein L33 [Bacilli bacterium]